MVNIGLVKLKDANVETFTTNTGLKIRKYINRPLRYILEKSTKGKIVLESYPNLEKDEAYIFSSTHFHCEDIISNLAVLDRNAYALMGTTDQIEHNPLMYGAWLNGFIYVDRWNKQSRKEAIPKMERVLKAGNSVLIWPEGSLNNTENLLIQKLFGGPYYLAKSTGKKVVPISNYLESETNTIYIRVGEPLDLTRYDKEEALDILRDAMASMMFEQIKERSVPIKRSELTGDHHLAHLEDRRQEYLKNKWTSVDKILEELVVYKDKNITTYEEILRSLENIEVTKDNAHIIAPLLEEIENLDKYNFKRYVKLRGLKK